MVALLFREIFLAYTAQGAYPVGWEVFEGCSGGYAVVGIAYCGVVYVAASVANILFHNVSWF
jgi:hypothetical protein